MKLSSDNGQNDNRNRKDNGEEMQDEQQPKENGFLCLPPIGESSFDPSNHMPEAGENSNGKKHVVLDSNKSTEVGLVGSAKFELQYTCAVCETRNTHKVSRLGRSLIPWI